MRSNFSMAILALLAGFAGGILSQHVTGPAQAASVAQSVVTAHDFRLVDAQGNVIAELATSKTHVWRAQLTITGYDGHFVHLGATNLVFGARKGGELGLGYLDDGTTAVFFEDKGHPRMDIDAETPGITMFGGKPSITLYQDEHGKQKLWSAP